MNLQSIIIQVLLIINITCNFQLIQFFDIIRIQVDQDSIRCLNQQILLFFNSLYFIQCKSISYRLYCYFFNILVKIVDVIMFYIILYANVRTVLCNAIGL